MGNWEWNMKWEIENGKLFFFCVGCSFSSVLWFDFMKNKYFLSSVDLLQTKDALSA